MTTPAHERLIVAVDVDTYEKADKLIGELHDHATWFKIGSHLFTKEGPRVCELVKNAGKKLFLDLKFHDIPNTVYGAVTSAMKLDVDMFTLHASGGHAMLRRAMDAALESGKDDVLPVAVTVLTHLGTDDFRALFDSNRAGEEAVIALARIAQESGLPGVVASARELPAIKAALGHDFRVVTPGIRLPDAAADDQTRVVTPERAIADGADFIVVGRPIYGAEDPAAACATILDRMASA